MRKASLFLAVLALVGCRNLEGPLEVRQKDRADIRDPDGRPLYSIDEQERRGRARYAYPIDEKAVGPNTYSDRPDPIGRGTSPGATGPFSGLGRSW